jgi:hypothetical protein
MRLRALVCSTFTTIVLTGLPTFVPRDAFAQLSDADRKATARSLFTQGVKEQEAGHYAEAIPFFEKAQKLFDAPTHLQRLAQCQIMVGKLVEAAETYETLKRMPLAPGAPEVFVQAKAQAEADLPALRARIPNLKVELTPKPEKLRNLQLVVNDILLPTELVGVARPVNPGATKIVARAEGYNDATLEVSLKEKESRTVALALSPGQGTLPPPVVVAPPPVQGVQPRPEPKHYDPDADKPKPTNGGTRIGFVYVPHVPINDNVLSLGVAQQNVGVEFEFGRSYFRYHLTVAYSVVSGSGGSLQGARIEPVTFGIGIPVHRKEGFRVEIEPTFALLNFNVMGLSGSQGNDGGFVAVSTGADVRVNLVFGKFFLGLSPLGFDVRWAGTFAFNNSSGGGLGAGVDYRPRIFVGGEF